MSQRLPRWVEIWVLLSTTVLGTPKASSTSACLFWLRAPRLVGARQSSGSLALKVLVALRNDLPIKR